MASISRLISQTSSGATSRRVLAGILLACAGTLASAAAPTIAISDGWVRWLPGELPAAGYLTITNNGDKPVTLVGMTSPDYGMAMLHQTTNEGSLSKMIMVDKLTIPAHGKVQFSPGNYHVMLEQPKRSLAPGANIQLQLKFSDGETVVAPLPIKPPGTTQ
ncbi:copper chaperone PCu(A)C [Pararobbsia alpina]|nr:copper chaperone PCu(A)C [Pararobbsia alpina]